MEDHVFLSNYFPERYWNGRSPAAVDLEEFKEPIEIIIRTEKVITQHSK